MKKLYLPLLLFSMLLNAQSWQWGKRGGSNNNIGIGLPEQVTSMANDNEGNVYILSPVGVVGLDIDGHSKQGYSSVENPIAPDQMIASFSCDGTYRWSKVFGGWGSDYGTAIKTDAQGNIYVSSYFDLTYTGHPANQIDSDFVFPQSSSNETSYKQNIYLFKYDKDGNLLWLKTPQPDSIDITDPNADGRGFPLALETDAAGNSWWWLSLSPGVYANGAYTIATGGDYIFNYDAAGDFVGAFPLNMQLIGGSGLPNVKMRRNPDSGVIYFIGSCETLFGDTATFNGQSVVNQLYIAAFDSEGTFLWKKESTTNSFTATINDSSIDADGSIYVTGNGRPNMAYGGHIFTSTNGNTFPYIMKLNADGDLIWATNCTTTAGTGGYGITRGGLTGNYFGMTWDGITLTATGQGYDVFLARFNPENGDIIALDGLLDDDGYADFGTAIARDVHDNFYVGGMMEHFLYVNSATPMVNEGPETDFFRGKIRQRQLRP
jgi:hypothetical protein